MHNVWFNDSKMHKRDGNSLRTDIIFHYYSVEVHCEAILISNILDQKHAKTYLKPVNCYLNLKINVSTNMIWLSTIVN